MMGCCSQSCLLKAQMVMGIVFGLWNNITTVINAKNLFEKGHAVFGWLCLFFLMFPGLVTSVGFLILHFLGHRKIGKIPPGSVLLYCGLFLFFYPVVPIALCGYTLITGRKRHLAALAKLFEGFLDDGPQFVLKLIVVVFYQIADIIFTISMVTSFIALVFFGLSFNELNTNRVVRIWLCLPMLAAFAGARAFTLAVFLKETLANTTEWVGGVFVLALFCLINVGWFKYCGQDLIRSVVFGLCSLLIPAGYNNIAYFYQCPDQALIVHSINPTECQVGQRIVERYGDDGSKSRLARKNTLLDDVEAEAFPGSKGNPCPDEVFGNDTEMTLTPSAPPLEPPEGGEDAQTEMRGERNPQRLGSVVIDSDLSEMKSGRFLILYTLSNALLIAGCAVYLTTSRDLDAESDDALILPLLLAVVPGTFFALARSLLLPDLKPSRVPPKVWKPIKITLCLILSVVAYCSLGPAIFWSTLYKLLKTVDTTIGGD
eukprot:maker-scaffold580_size130538-snap-gene-0.24 protein:Tk07483 transcript:maker-scaffold580_size130538-snap-gene-0.24-mRNA-1 annotation:"xk-related protein"